jgi:predicted SnoaL-like aldol condensation-catalyzing enzyme
LFRVENNRIAEHWDVIEAIPAKETWKNNNGKF